MVQVGVLSWFSSPQLVFLKDFKSEMETNIVYKCVQDLTSDDKVVIEKILIDIDKSVPWDNFRTLSDQMLNENSRYKLISKAEFDEWFNNGSSPARLDNMSMSKPSQATTSDKPKIGLQVCD